MGTRLGVGGPMGEGVGGFAVKGGGLRCLPFFRARRSSLGTRDAADLPLE